MIKTKHTFVDICWTLFYSNTTFDFLDYLIQEPSYLRLRKLHKLRFFYLLNLLIFKTFNIDIHRTLAIRYLKGMSKDFIYQQVENFYNEVLSKKRIESVWNCLPKENIILISATLAPIAEVVAEHLGAWVDFCASTLEFQNGICTGRLTNDLLGKKQAAINAYTNFAIITDNTSDAPLVLAAQHATIIVYNNLKRWNKLLHNKNNITFIHVSQPTNEPTSTIR